MASKSKRKKTQEHGGEEHPSQVIAIKDAPVDLEMLPVVRWLNSYRWVTTRWCCQGNGGTPREKQQPCVEQPYVVFWCEQQITLAVLLEKVGFYAIVEVEWQRESGCVRYIMRFRDWDSLQRFKKNLEDGHDAL